VTAERLSQLQAVFPDAILAPAILPPSSAEEAVTPEAALIELIRGRLEGQGPTTLAQLAETFGLPDERIAAALTALEVEGFALAGSFTPSSSEREWCERRLLARIHRYTMKRLRAEIEPVAARDYLRFLFDWQGVSAETQREGGQALDAIIEQLAGFEAPAAAWESAILPARLSNYEPRLLDDTCMTGRAAWARLKAPSAKAKSNGRGSAPLKSTPISLFPRKTAAVWAQPLSADPAPVAGKAAKVAKFIRENGASFFDEIVDGTRLLRTEVEDALAELVAAGQVISDSFSGLRMLLNPPRHHKRRPNGGRLAGAGRWALAKRKPAIDAAWKARSAERLEHIAVALLRRYGVVFMRMLDREAAWLPRWRDLLRVYRKLEARGEIRGGRFVSGFSGEQFALPEAVAALRAIRRRTPDGSLVSVSGADPLNLAGILTPGPKLAALTGNRVLYRDGIPVAFLEGDNSRFLEPLDPSIENLARLALHAHAQPAAHRLRLRRLAQLEQARRESNRGGPYAA
jgi:ATP-dependent Lhr-like helicase